MALGQSETPSPVDGASSQGRPSVQASASPRATTPAPDPAPSAKADASVENLQAAVVGFVDAVDSVSADSDPAAFADVVSGAARDELEAQQLEFAANGWSLTGDTKVDGVSVLASDPAGNPPSARVQACVDSSAVVVVDADGKPVPSNPDAVRRALNIYDLNFVDGVWRVVSHSFPDDPTC